MVKGSAPIDEYFDQKLAKNYHVLVEGGKVFSTTLNQTNIKNNNNKFYLLQILQSDSNPNSCYFFTRWGRVGVPGQFSNQGPYSKAVAMNFYTKKYDEKYKKGDYR